MNFSDEQIDRAVTSYPKRVTGPMAGCKHPEAVLRYALTHDGPCVRLAENYVRSMQGACWNAMCDVLPTDGWLVWYGAESASAKAVALIAPSGLSPNCAASRRLVH